MAGYRVNFAFSIPLAFAHKFNFKEKIWSRNFCGGISV
jgi:hypothetical protein